MKLCYPLILMLLSFASETSAVSTYVGFKSNVEVASADKKIALSRLVFVQSESVTQNGLAVISELTIQNAKVIKAEDVLAVLKKQQELKAFDFAWRGQTSLFLKQTSHGFNSDEIIDQAKQALESVVGSQFERYEVEPTNKVVSLRTSQAYDDFGVYVGQQEDIKKRMPVIIKLFNQGELVHQQNIWFKVSAYREALVAKRNIQAFESYHADLVEFKWVDVTKAQSSYFVEMPKGNLWFARRVGLGKVITRSVLVAEPEVKRKQLVTLVYADKAVAIEAKGIAQKSGYKGEAILVKLAESDKAVKAIVQGKNRARVLNE